MKISIPLFPLDLVVFKGESLHLHIFEERYKQLVQDIVESDGRFGVPSFIHQRMELGTLVELVRVDKHYKDGRMDITTQALQVFHITEFEKCWNQKLYPGGHVELINYHEGYSPATLFEVKALLVELFTALDQPHLTNVSEVNLIGTYGHKIGLSAEEEYELLELSDEQMQLNYIHNHLTRFLPTVRRTERARKKILENGHFKDLDPLSF